MRRKKHRTAKILFTLFLLCSFKKSTIAQINISAAQTAQALAQKLAGQGVTISNAALNCPAQANGFFSVVSSNIGIDSGIVLTTGRAATQGSNYGINGPSAYLASTDNGAPGDPVLNTLAGESTVDACSLEFDVIPNGDSIRFNYVFSSEEYKNAVCGPYNDAFAFLISGPGISGADNMALVPGTNIPVTINSINDGIPGSTGHISNCTEMGAGAPFTTYYLDNASGATLTHQGFTQVLQAVHAVNHCSIYHLKIVIADAGDPLYDSGVFLKAGSLQTGNYSISAVAPVTTGDTSIYCVKGCLPGSFIVKRSIVNTQPQTIKFVISGTAVSGIDYSPFPDSVIIPANDATAPVVINGLPTPPLGSKTIQISILSPYSCLPGNNVIDSASMTIFDTLNISATPADTVVCGRDTVLLNVIGYDFLSYRWSPATGLSSPTVKSPAASPVVNTDYQVTASLPGSSCPLKTAQVKFTIKLTPGIEMQADTAVCFNAQFKINATATGYNAYNSYLWSGPGGFVSTLLSPVINNAASQNSGLYTLSVTNDTNGCKSNAAVNIAVNTPATPTVISPTVLCLDNTPVPLTAAGDSLLWYNATDSIASPEPPVPSTSHIADYSYYVSQRINNCESPKAEIDIEVEKCCDGTIFIPTAFTPNGDGMNDKFEAVEDYGYFIYSMYVFNRWGQVVYSGTVAWDGSFGGRPAETGTYYYTIKFGCIQGGTVERKGDVILIR